MSSMANQNVVSFQGTKMHWNWPLLSSFSSSRTTEKWSTCSYGASHYILCVCVLPPCLPSSFPRFLFLFLERNTINGGEIQRRKISLFNVIIRGYYLSKKIEARVERNKGCHEQSIADRIRTTHFWNSEQFDWNRCIRKIIAIMFFRVLRHKVRAPSWISYLFIQLISGNHCGMFHFKFIIFERQRETEERSWKGCYSLTDSIWGKWERW